MRIFIKTFLVSLALMAFLMTTGASAKLDLSRLLLFWSCDDGSGDVLKDGSGNGFDAKIGGKHV